MNLVWNWEEVISAPALLALGTRLFRIAAVVLIALVVTRLINGWLPRLRLRFKTLMKQRPQETGTELELAKRAETLGSVVRKTLATVVWGIALMMCLKEAGFDVAPILAGAGVVGLAVGFGAQTLVRDVISGIFMLIENQIRVGDVAVINGTGGLVEEINLRTTVLRSLDGAVHVVPNGAITSLSNLTREFSCAVFDIGVAYKEDGDRVAQVIREVGEELQKDEEFGVHFVEPLELFGLDRMADSAIVFKGRIKVMPGKHWPVLREFNRRIKKRFDELGIEIPFPQRTLHWGEGSEPVQSLNRDEVKAVVREVLEEAGMLSAPSKH
jgi:moderate conductance mechanosensitive channel